MASGKHDSILGSALGSERPQKISDALKVLDEAIASHGADLKDLISDDFKSLTSAIQGMKPKMKEVDDQVRKNPWPVIGGVAAGTFAIGFVLGRSGNESKYRH